MFTNTNANYKQRQYGATKESTSSVQRVSRFHTSTLGDYQKLETARVLSEHYEIDLVPDRTDKRLDHPTRQVKLCDIQSLLHLLKGNVGTGLLALPLAIKNAGLAVGGVSLFLLGIVCTHCMVTLVNVAHALIRRYPQFHTLNYSEAAKAAMLGYTRNRSVVKISGLIINIFLIITQFGFCCVYFVFVANNLTQVFCSAYGVTLATDNLHSTQAWIAIVAIPLAILCLERNLKNLSTLSASANFFILVSLGIILYEEIRLFISTDPSHQAAILRNATDSNGNPGGISYYPTAVTGLALFFGNAIFSFEGIGVVLPLENKMKKPQHFKAVLYTGMVITVFLYVSVGTMGYIVYGDGIQPSITLNLEIRDCARDDTFCLVEAILFLLAKLFYSYVIFATFMLQFYVPMDFLEPTVNKAIERLKKRCNLQSNRLNIILLSLFRILTVLLIAALAVAIPDLGDLISLVGAVASNCLALIFPPLLNILVFFNRDHLPWRSVSSVEAIKQAAWMTKDILIIVLGVLGFGFGAYASIEHMVGFFQEYTDTPVNCSVLYPHVRT